MARKLISFDRLKPEKGITDSRTTIARKMKAGKFPQCVRSSTSRINWYDDEIDDHIANLERGNAVNYRGNKKEEEKHD